MIGYRLGTDLVLAQIGGGYSTWDRSLVKSE